MRGVDELSADALQGIPIETLRKAWQRVGRWSPVVAPPVFPNGISPIEGVRKGLAGDVAVMSGTNRDENNLFMARMSNTPSREELEHRVAEIISGEETKPSQYDAYSVRMLRRTYTGLGNVCIGPWIFLSS